MARDWINDYVNGERVNYAAQPAPRPIKGEPISDEARREMHELAELLAPRRDYRQQQLPQQHDVMPRPWMRRCQTGGCENKFAEDQNGKRYCDECHRIRTAEGQQRFFRAMDGGREEHDAQHMPYGQQQPMLQPMPQQLPAPPAQQVVARPPPIGDFLNHLAVHTPWPPHARPVAAAPTLIHPAEAAHRRAMEVRQFELQTRREEMAHEVTLARIEAERERVRRVLGG
nr:hypothetical protein B0A51_18292 [Rachicladosporium sp. CCFEE 5018]